jgi:hypothetical protein
MTFRKVHLCRLTEGCPIAPRANVQLELNEEGAGWLWVDGELCCFGACLIAHRIGDLQRLHIRFLDIYHSYFLL